MDIYTNFVLLVISILIIFLIKRTNAQNQRLDEIEKLACLNARNIDSVVEILANERKSLVDIEMRVLEFMIESRRKLDELTKEKGS